MIVGSRRFSDFYCKKKFRACMTRCGAKFLGNALLAEWKDYAHNRRIKEQAQVYQLRSGYIIRDNTTWIAYIAKNENELLDILIELQKRYGRLAPIRSANSKRSEAYRSRLAWRDLNARFKRLARF